VTQLAPGEGGQGPDWDDGNLLEQVVLKSFTASPSTILPFESSRLFWDVAGPAVGFGVELDGRQVVSRGDKFIQPLSTTEYRLTGSIGRLGRLLGVATVTVDEQACHVLELPNEAVRGAVNERVDQTLSMNPRIRERERRKVVVGAQGIDVALHLEARVDNFPDPEIEVEGHFTYFASGESTKVYFSHLHADVSWPWWVWLIPGSQFFLALASGDIKAEAEENIQRAAEHGARRVDAYVHEHFRLHSVRFTTDSLFVESCPDPRRFSVERPPGNE
jgi:hypothetical protein